MKSALYAMPEGALEPANNGNAGLWYDKYCNTWPIVNGEVVWELKAYKEGNREINPKFDWIESVTGKVGDDKLLGELAQRRERMSKRLWQCEPLLFKTEWRFVTGLGQAHPVENGFAWHHALGVPYLPGPSVKGMTRALAEQWENVDPEDADRIFGPHGAGEVGSVIFLDALPTSEVRLETDIMTPHYGRWYSDGETPGDWHDPVPIPFLTVAAGQSFQFLVTPRRPQSESDMKDAEAARAWLKEALEWIGAGAKTAVGYGRMTALGEKEAAALVSDMKAVQTQCEWVDQQIEAVVNQTHCKSEEALRGKLLAQAWSEIDDSILKKQALDDIRNRWQIHDWWENPPGPAARKAKKIYETGA